MPFNVLILPLLGGYIFITQWYRTRYYMLRADGQRLLFNSAFTGALFLSVATVLVIICERYQWAQLLYQQWRQTVPFQYSGRATLALLLGSCLWLPLNYIWSEEKEIQRVIFDKADALEVLLRRAAGEKRFVAFSLKSGKIYIGSVSTVFNPAFPLEHISIIPVISGYRHAEDKRMIPTNFYQEIYDKLKAEIAQELLQAEQERNPAATEAEWLAAIKEQVDQKMQTLQFEIVIPRSEIQSANFFDRKIYQKYFRTKKAAATRAAKKTASATDARSEGQETSP